MRLLLTILIIITAFASTMIGVILITDPSGNTLGLSTNLLKETPFNNYMLPGILLVASVSSINLLAVFHSMERDDKRYNWSMAGGIAMSVWTIIQMAWLQSAHWINMMFLMIGFFIIILSYQLKGKWAV